MSISVNEKYCLDFIPKDSVGKYTDSALKARETLLCKSGKGSDYTGWVTLPVDYDKEEFARIKLAAEKIRNSCDILIVIGIGGSYLGARAAIEFIKSPYYNTLAKSAPDIYFAGNSINPDALYELLEICKGKDICLNVISKSGTTTEPAIAFRVFRELLIEKYGKKEAMERTYVTTDKARGALKALADAEGCETFVVPDDVGGRYSVLTAVGLLPIAVAGIDIDAMMQGAADMRESCINNGIDTNPALKYAVYRNILYSTGKKTEIMACYDAAYAMMNEWWKQLYGESEGKDGKGIFPASVIFSTDLHSLGQYIQDGERTLFETLIRFGSCSHNPVVPHDEANSDGLNFLSGVSLYDINRKAEDATVLAHTDGGVPNIIIELAGRDPYTFGQLVYFFEFACGVSGYMLDVNPFNQPGVEAYKVNMYALLGKPGYEDKKAELEERLQK